MVSGRMGFRHLDVANAGDEQSNELAHAGGTFCCDDR